MVKCVKCNEKALYDSPDDFCENHWLKWWNESKEDETLTTRERSRVVVLGQLILANRSLFEEQVKKDTAISDCVKDAILKFPEEPVSLLEKEVYGVLTWVKKHKIQNRKRKR